MTIKQRNISPFSSILKGEFITNQISRDLIPLLILIVFLALINIKSSFNAENLLKKSINLEREVAENIEINSYQKFFSQLESKLMMRCPL